MEILVPRDITDPLNLKGGDGDEVGGVLLSPLKSRRRHRNRQHGGGQKEAMAARLFTSTAGLTGGLTPGWREERSGFLHVLTCCFCRSCSDQRGQCSSLSSSL